MFTIWSPGNMLLSGTSPTCQFRIFLLPVLDVVYCAACAQHRVNLCAKQHGSMLSFS